MRTAMVVVAMFVVSAAAAETRSTRCQATPVKVEGLDLERRLVGCGDGFAENLLWHLDRADSVSGELDGRFHKTATGHGVVVYVVDTGVMRDHQEFERAAGSNVIAGYTTNAPIPPSGTACKTPDPALQPCTHIVVVHGTSVASLVAGGVVGLAPDAKIVSVFGGAESGSWLQSLDAIVKHAFDPSSPPFRTAIVNLSGGSILPASQRDAIEARVRTMTAGVDANGNPDPNGKRFLFVAAAGNLPVSGSPSSFSQCGVDGGVVMHPANMGTQVDGIVAVGGITRENRLWEGSCRGPLLEVLAPAHDIFLASLGGRDHYRLDPEWMRSGTSYATPYVTGIAAQLLELDPSLTPAQLEAQLKASPSRAEGLPVPIVPPAPKKRRAVR